ncbi:hypothetical protein YSY22_20310 [Brevibacillus formosus]
MGTRYPNVGIGKMPLAFIETTIARLAKIISHRRDSIAIEPEHVAVGRAFSGAAGLGDAVQRGILTSE